MIGVMLVKSNSVRLPDKNFLEMDGKPMWKHNVDKMLHVCDKVYIVTDTYGYRRIENSGATVLFRPKNMEGTDVTSCEILSWLIHTCSIEEDVLLTQATNPTLTHQTIEQLVNNHKRHGSRNTITINGATCKPDGNVYVIHPDLLKITNSLFTVEMWVRPTGKGRHVLNREACDIDTWEDYCITNAIMEGRVI